MTEAMLHVQVTINVCVFVFDLLYVDGESLVHLPLRARRDRMSTSLSMRPGYLQAAQALEFPPHLTPSGAPAIESIPIKAPSGTQVDASPVPALGLAEEQKISASAPSSSVDTKPEAVLARDLVPNQDTVSAANEDMRSGPYGGNDEDMRSDEPHQADEADAEMRGHDGDLRGSEAESDAGISGDEGDEEQPKVKRVKRGHSNQAPAEGQAPADAPQVW